MRLDIGVCFRGHDVGSKTLAKSKAGHLGEAIAKNTGESRCHAADEVEDCVSLLQFVTRVPATRAIVRISSVKGRMWNKIPEQVCTAWEETSFKNTENKSKRNHLSPCLAETLIWY